MMTDEKLDELIALLKQTNKMLGSLGLIVARISTLVLVLVILIILGVVIIVIF